jgi:hypothetical protein
LVSIVFGGAARATGIVLHINCFFNFHIWNKSKVNAGKERLGETMVAKVGASLWMSVTHEPLV